MQSTADSPAAHLSRGPLGALAGILPFICLGANALLSEVIPRGNLVGGFFFVPETPAEYLGIAPWLVWTVPVIVGFAVGWARGFPRWSYSYLGMLLLVMPEALLAPSDSQSGSYGILSWIPAATLLVSIVLAALTSWRKLGRLAKGIGDDWTRLSFAILALLTPFYLGVIHDSPGALTWAMLALVGFGSVAYLLTDSVRAGALSLLVTVFLMATIPEVWLWVVQLDNPLSGGALSLVAAVMYFAAGLLALVFWPALIGLLRRGRNRPKQSESGTGG